MLGENNAPMLDKIAWYGGNSSVGYKGAGWATIKWPHQAFPGKLAGPRRVGQKQANAWGLKDMLGNVYEWVFDFSTVPDGEDVDPRGPATGPAIPTAEARGITMPPCPARPNPSKLPPPTVNSLGFRVALVKNGLR